LDYIDDFKYHTSFVFTYFGTAIILIITDKFKIPLILLAGAGPQVALWIPAFFAHARIENKKKTKKKQFTLKLFMFAILNHVFLSSVLGYWCFASSLTNENIQFMLERKDLETTFQLHVFWKYFFDFLGMTLIADCLFWSFHLLLHTSTLFQLFHSLHHQIIYPEPLTTFYVHPVEHILVNLFPIFLGPLILKPYPPLLLIWLTLSTFSAVENHSGNQDNFFRNSEFHDMHHRYVNMNYGISGLFDLFYSFRTAKNGYKIENKK